MKKLFIALALLLASSAHAAGPYTTTVQKNKLAGVHFNSNEVTTLIDVFGTAGSFVGTLTSSAGIILKVDNDAQRLFTFDATSDVILTQTWGDAGTTAVQKYAIGASTADADDDSTLILSGGGGAVATDSSRGGVITINGNEVSVAGDIVIKSGAATGSVVQIDATPAAGTIDFITAGAGVRWRIDGNGLLVNVAGGSGGNLELQATGTSIALQEATAGSACMGTITANGTTPVVATTSCAKTSSRIFLTKTSTSTVNGSCYNSAIVNNTSFSITCLATDTGTYNWFIMQEAG